MMMLRNGRRKKFITALLLAVAVLLAAAPAAARWDELVDPTAYGDPAAIRETGDNILPGGTYRVQRGDTLTGIAARFGVSAHRLAEMNGLSNRDRIYAGQVLRLPVAVLIHRVQQGETLLGIASRYGVDLESIVACNDIKNENLLPAGATLSIPLAAQAAAVSAAAVLPVGSLPWPVLGWISSPFGIREGRPHEGIDIAADAGAPIKAVRGGRVIFAGPRGTYGLTVIVDHGGGLTTLYAHCSKLLVREGELVGAGQVIAEVGSTGRSTGPHLHLEVRLNGIPYDPALCLNRIYA